MAWVLSGFADEAGETSDEQIQAITKAGFGHIDLRGVDGYNITELPEVNAHEVKKKLDDAGIRVCMYGTPIGKIDIKDDFQTDVDRLAHIARMRDVFGSDQVRIFSYYNRDEQPQDQWRDETFRRLERLRDLADDFSLVLFHENERHIYGDRCEQVLDLAELRNGTTFKLIFDFDNYNQSGDDVWANWERLCDRTDAFHLKDSDKNNQHTPVGEGNGQVRKILADAAKRGWKGPLVLEPHLRHSAAVMATGPSGQENVKYADMSAAEVFQVAAEKAKELIREVGGKAE